MIVLVSGGAPHAGVGKLIVPGAGNVPSDGEAWAADNGAFSGFDEEAFLKMLRRLEPYRSTCLFVTCPDVVGNAEATLANFAYWAPRLRDWPLALVAQDGLTPEQVPWDELAAIFVGGTTLWKMGPDAARVVRAAKDRGLWAHMGRVNSIQRMVYAGSIGIDSVDGSSFSRWSNRWIPMFRRVAENQQLALELTREEE